VAAFEAAATRADRAAGPEEELAALREAAELYRGDLLESGYDEWLLEERERLRRRWLQALERLVELLEARGEPAQAVGHAERLLRADPLREATYRTLMRLHDARGDRARALRAYHACAATLERELGVEPSAATRQAYEALLPPAEPAGPYPGVPSRSPLRARRRACPLCTSPTHSQPGLADGPTRGSPGTPASRKACRYARSWSIRART
jgi:DNA-binding SARP family transcriptional activator